MHFDLSWIQTGNVRMAGTIESNLTHRFFEILCGLLANEVTDRKINT